MKKSSDVNIYAIDRDGNQQKQTNPFSPYLTLFPGQEVSMTVSATSKSEDGAGIKDVQELIKEANKAGWADLPDACPNTAFRL